MKTENQKNSSKKQQKPLNNYLQFTGLAFQILAALLIGYWLGEWLDTRMQNNKPWFTVSLMVLFIVATLVRVIREITHE